MRKAPDNQTYARAIYANQALFEQLAMVVSSELISGENILAVIGFEHLDGGAAPIRMVAFSDIDKTFKDDPLLSRLRLAAENTAKAHRPGAAPFLCLTVLVDKGRIVLPDVAIKFEKA